MGTTWSARIVVDRDCDALRTGIQAAFDAVVAEMSNWEAGSDLSRFNSAPLGVWQLLPQALMTVLRTALAMAETSGGAFDPAVGRLVDHWGFGPAASPAPATAVRNGWRAIEIDGDRARRTADVALDFGGIAKGYGIDAVAEWLLHAGIDNFLIEAGGELRGEGIKPDCQPWWVDLEPVPGLAMPVTRLALCGLSVATSGDYRRFRMRGQQRDSHSIDPRTRSPIRNNVASVSVVHPSAMLADAWATALTVLGQDAGMALAAQHGIAALMITRTADGATEAQSPAFAAMLA